MEWQPERPQETQVVGKVQKVWKGRDLKEKNRRGIEKVSTENQTIVTPKSKLKNIHEQLKSTCAQQQTNDVRYFGWSRITARNQKVSRRLRQQKRTILPLRNSRKSFFILGSSQETRWRGKKKKVTREKTT